MTHICVCKLTNLGSDNGLSPGRRQAIIWTNAGILFIGTLGTNFSEFLIGIQAFSFKKMHLKMSSVKWRPFCLRLNVLMLYFSGTNVVVGKTSVTTPEVLWSCILFVVSWLPSNQKLVTIKNTSLCTKNVFTKYLWLAHKYCMNLFIQSFLSSGWTKTVTQSTAINYDVASKALLLLKLI